MTQLQGQWVSGCGGPVEKSWEGSSGVGPGPGTPTRGLKETQRVPGSTGDQTRDPAVEVRMLHLRTSRGSPSCPCV